MDLPNPSRLQIIDTILQYRQQKVAFMYPEAIKKPNDIASLIETPEEYIEYPANELEFDDVCLYPTAESLEICMKHHHGNLDKLPEYLYIMLIKILDNGGIPYINNSNQMVENDKEKTAKQLVKQWLTVRDDSSWNGIWFRKR